MRPLSYFLLPSFLEGPMKIVTKMSSSIAASAVALALAAGSVFAHDPPEVPTKAGADHAQMSDMHDKSAMHDMKMTGDQDYDFAAMMRKHHEMGLDMAKKELREGDAPKMKQMAQKIIDAQTKEIAELDAWMAKNKPASK